MLIWKKTHYYFLAVECLIPWMLLANCMCILTKYVDFEHFSTTVEFWRWSNTYIVIWIIALGWFYSVVQPFVYFFLQINVRFPLTPNETYGRRRVSIHIAWYLQWGVFLFFPVRSPYVIYKDSWFFKVSM